jgi:hypothetical protein
LRHNVLQRQHGLSVALLSSSLQLLVMLLAGFAKFWVFVAASSVGYRLIRLLGQLLLLLLS